MRFLKGLQKFNLFQKTNPRQKRRLILTIFALGAIACFGFQVRHILFDHENLAGILQILPCCVVPLFLGLYIVLTIFGIPGTVLTTAGGILFGLSWGTFWSVVGATLGALGAFWAARYILQDWAGKRFRDHRLLKKIRTSVSKKPLAIVLALRFAPITPFNLLNFLFGLTPIHWVPYTLGTFIGIIPGTILYTWLGVSGKTALSGGDRLPLIMALTALCLLSLIPPVLMNKYRHQ
ncbi:SNARE associated Golgi-related protein [[Leptolyngbya] sp. PCC 7376]|uniref:TVP38/TMEM64 family protein n=1 Tax=[Leptolyngbya] sp. PCC 7376 TaxID=111781 RepID=UPI00029F2D33|nr:TVP38/TMEM64 family protein [[Leptolyngbya] sp. PCC 7376]AFY40455.1 SNARE associated Golgi-related protein [[Leptolyngbya] sp. PCC 7376]